MFYGREKKNKKKKNKKKKKKRWFTFTRKKEPDLINDMLNVIALRVDYTCVVDMQKARHLLLVIPYMVGVQNNNVSALMRH
ncbi:hypothetical protein C5167_027236 [Papaver somniferum]|nr:hypothetical protein C5167_027236 [Papaver somniferum]